MSQPWPIWLWPPNGRFHKLEPSSRQWRGWPQRGFSLGKPTTTRGVRYWPVPPLGVFYAVAGDELRVLQIVDARRMTNAL